jgi:FlaG/FlaF family flagellin (archaellin)
MEYTRLWQDDRAASPTFGVVLLGVIIVLVAVAVGAAVMAASDSPGESPPSAAFIFDFDDEATETVDDYGLVYRPNGSTNGSYERVVGTNVSAEKIGLVRITYTDGPPLDASRLAIAGNRLTETEGWTTEYSPHDESETITNGETFTLWMHVEDELRITWEGEAGTAVLQRYERPAR